MEKYLWDANSRPSESLSTLKFQDLSNLDGIREAVTLILKYGFCFINDSPISTKHGTRAALEKITKISNIGPWTESAWELTSEYVEQFSDTAFTSLYLGPHTDGTYMLHPPG